MQIHKNNLENMKSKKAVRSYAREQQRESLFYKRIREDMGGPQILTQNRSKSACNQYGGWSLQLPGDENHKDRQRK